MLTGFWTQLGVRVLGQDLDRWGDILVIAVMAVLWLIGGLAKVITSKKRTGQQRPQEGAAKPQRQRATWQERLARKAEEMQRAAEAGSRQSDQEARARTQAASSPPAGKVAIRKSARGESVLVYERPASPPSTEREQQAVREREARKAILAARQQAAKAPSVEPQIQVGGPASEPMIEGMTVAMREPPMPLEPAIARPETGEPAGGYDPAAIIDYSDPDALRKAVLLYEILGKPLAFREPVDEPSSF